MLQRIALHLVGAFEELMDQINRSGDVRFDDVHSRIEVLIDKCAAQPMARIRKQCSDRSSG